MFRNACILLFLAGASWGIIGKLTGDWQLAGYVLVAVLIFGYLLLALAFRTAMPEVKSREADQLSQALTATRKKAKDLDAAKSAFIPAVVAELKGPAEDMKKYASLLLQGAFGKLPPAGNEAVSHISDAAERITQSLEKYSSKEAEGEKVFGEKGIASIKNVKVQAFSASIPK
ncbi:hypothetical protein HY090_00215 [Candidatus Kaiserbacteria bacterium]|nr:hypothetical protein [Candidatus Kaiserbacteria bacterium]